MDAQIAEIRAEVERLTDRRGEMQRKLETIKFSGAGTTDFNHDMIDKLSREGDEARRKLKVIREEHEKVEKMNLEVKQSIDAMARKLNSVSIETPAGVVSGGVDLWIGVSGGFGVSCSVGVRNEVPSQHVGFWAPH